MKKIKYSPKMDYKKPKITHLNTDLNSPNSPNSQNSPNLSNSSSKHIFKANAKMPFPPRSPKTAIFPPGQEFEQELSDHWTIHGNLGKSISAIIFWNLPVYERVPIPIFTHGLHITTFNTVSRLAARKLEGQMNPDNKLIPSGHTEVYDVERYKKITNYISRMPWGIICTQETDQQIPLLLNQAGLKIQYQTDEPNPNRGGLLCCITNPNSFFAIPSQSIYTVYDKKDGSKGSRLIAQLNMININNILIKILNCHLPAKYSELDINVIINYNVDVIIGDFNLSFEYVKNILTKHYSIVESIFNFDEGIDHAFFVHR